MHVLIPALPRPRLLASEFEVSLSYTERPSISFFFLGGGWVFWGKGVVKGWLSS